MTTPEANLLPCPFCRGHAVIRVLLSGPYVTCTRCGGSMRCYPTKAEAITAWNTRPQEAPASASDLETRLRARDADWQVQCDHWFSTLDRETREACEGVARLTIYAEAADALASQAAEIARLERVVGEARELLRQTANALAVSDKNDPLEYIADNGMTVWDGMRAESERLWPKVTAFLATNQKETGSAD